MTAKLIRVGQNNNYSKSIILPYKVCRSLNISKGDILSCRISKTNIVLSKVEVS